MTKSKRIFGFVFISFLLILVMIILSFYDNVRETVNFKANQILASDLNEDFQYFTLAMAKEVDPNYEILSFDDDIKDKIKIQISNKFYSIMNYTKYCFQNDCNFVYSVKNTVTNAEISNNLNKISVHDDKTKYNFYSIMSYDENGNWNKEGDIYDESFSCFSLQKLLQFYYHMEDETSISKIINIDGYSISLDKIKINQPKNLEIVYIVPENIIAQGYFSKFINRWQNYNSFSVASLIVCGLLLALFVICWPIKIFGQCYPFASIKKWKAEISIVILTSMITFGIIGCMVLTGYTINGYLITYIDSFNFSNVNLIVIVLNFLSWFLTLFAISMGLFQIKYICIYGFIRYLKDNTLIGMLLSYLKSKLDIVDQIDLSVPMNKMIMKYVIINVIIIFILLVFCKSYIAVIFYTFWVFLWLKDKVNKIQRDYNRLLKAAQELGKGNFEIEIDTDLGVFNCLKIEFNNIKTGFEKAVEEEIKSQNMKNELIGNVSHDLKTPLTCIKNYIVLLQDDSLTKKTRHEYLDSLNLYVNRLTTLIEDLFEISKINSGNIQLDLMNLNIIALLEQTFAESKETLEAKNLIMIKKYDSNDIKLMLDGNKTYRIFENLFINITKYAMINSRVYLEVKDYKDKVIIEFKNISATQMNFTADEIVERFIRGDKSRHETGSGLGLAIAKSFTEIQGGQFKIDIDGDLFKTIISFNKTVLKS